MLKHSGTTHCQLLPRGPSGERDIKVMSNCCCAWGKVQVASKIKSSAFFAFCALDSINFCDK